MNVAFRVDASLALGTGHIMRCLVLADALRDTGARVLFISRTLPPGMGDMLRHKGFSLAELPNDADVPFQSILDREHTLRVFQQQAMPIDWLVVDHYSIDAAWEAAMRSSVGRIFVIDDLADRAHNCDLLLDQNPVPEGSDRYRDLIPQAANRFYGPRYALLRKEFLALESHRQPRHGAFRHLLIFLGGSDPTNETMKAVRALIRVNDLALTADVVVGIANEHAQEVRQWCEKTGITFHHATEHMGELMLRADLAIGAGGTTSLERCFMGLPALTLILADNQAVLADALAKAGAAITLGWHERVHENDIAKQLRFLHENPRCLAAMSANSLKIMGESEYLGARGLVALMNEQATISFRHSL